MKRRNYTLFQRDHPSLWECSVCSKACIADASDANLYDSDKKGIKFIANINKDYSWKCPYCGANNQGK